MNPCHTGGRLLYSNLFVLHFIHTLMLQIVPENEFEMFRETMDSDISTISSADRLVCYFEDGSLYANSSDLLIIILVIIAQ